MERLNDRAAIITGAGSGIGRATVLRLLQEGARVVACDISEDGLQGTAKQAAEAGLGTRLETQVLDVSVEAETVAAVRGAVERLGGLDVLVNAAAIQICAHTHEHTLADWERTLAVNLTGTFLMVREALPALRASGRGVVINFSSTAAQFAHPYMAAYAASKGAIQGFTHTLALEYARDGLRAVCVQPGGVETALALGTLDRMPADYDIKLWTKQIPLLGGGRLASPESVAAVVAMLASDDGAAITGTEIRVDGGAHA